MVFRELYIMEKFKIQPTGVERRLRDEDIIVSKTDPTGRIVYVNQTFLKISDFTESDVIGMPHSVVRHPEMPRSVFTYVCNLAKNGDHYWVLANVTPTFDQEGNIIGYHSNRRAPDRKILATIQELYKLLLEEEGRHSDRRKGLLAATELLQSIVKERASAYDEFVFSL
jgi:hypothetical protein